jgi:hypothetical protein
MDFSRGARRARFVALAALAAGFVGCAISFDGYELETDSGSAPSAGGATGTSGGLLTGGAGTTTGSSGSSNGGSIGVAGLPEMTGGASGSGGNAKPDASTAGGGGAPDAGRAGAGGAGGGGGGAGGSPGCPVADDEMSTVPIPMGAPGYPGSYCVDRTEVTAAQYAAWLATNPSTAGQLPSCSWNNTFAPQASAGINNCENLALNYDPVGRNLRPVVCIDWCDAYAYCKAVGKRLCGAFGGGSVPASEVANAKNDEWFNACSAGGTKNYPYGATYDGARCNGLDYGQTGSIDVATANNCVGGYAAIHDMSGNVAEWEDGCGASAGAGDPCPIRGGYFNSSDVPSNSAACSAAPTTARSRLSRQIGFRCCFDGK